MPQYTYKCVEAPFSVDTSKNLHSAVITHYQDIINKAAQDGWELDLIDTVTSVQKPGCGGGSKPEEMTFKMLIFRKLVD